MTQDEEGVFYGDIALKEISYTQTGQFFPGK
jgi:hypothetical protein